MIKIVTVGKIKEKFFQEAITEYQKRMSKYIKLEIIETKEYNDFPITTNITKEGTEILKHISDKDFVILLDIKGEPIDSINLSQKISDVIDSSKNITFIIGGSNGVSAEVREKATYKISFSKLTFPHQLFRVMLMEQIYRCFKIINNEKYHK